MLSESGNSFEDTVKDPSKFTAINMANNIQINLLIVFIITSALK